MPIELFISGKNWRLSLAELTAYLKAREIKFEINFFSKEFFTLTFENRLETSVIDALGGTIKIGEEKTKFSTKIVKEAFFDR